MAGGVGVRDVDVSGSLPLFWKQGASFEIRVWGIKAAAGGLSSASIAKLGKRWCFLDKIRTRDG